MNLESILDDQILYEMYAEFLMSNPSDHIIHNGDSLIEAMESEVLLDEFIQSLEK